MIEPAVMRAVGVESQSGRWYGAVEAPHAEGYLWACLHDHRTEAEARGCAVAQLERYWANMFPTGGTTYRI